MESMRSLNRSLPGTTPPTETPEALLSAFRAAALSVTKLYKTASTEQGRTRAEGYQDALDELLQFLDKEDIGLSDGEGWRIRRWATERLDGREGVPQNVESDEEISDKTDRASSRSPEIQRNQPTPRPQSLPRSTRMVSPEQTEPSIPIHNIPPPIEEEVEPTVQDLTVPQSTFTFRAQQPYPENAESILADIETAEAARQQLRTTTGGSHGTNTRLTSQAARPNSRRLNNRGTTAITSIGRGAGQKRKNNFADYSDFFGIDLGRDKFGGGGKRGRHA